MCSRIKTAGDFSHIFDYTQGKRNWPKRSNGTFNFSFFLSFWGLLNILGVERFGVVALIYSIGKANQKKKSNNKIVGSKLVSRVIISF